MEFFCFNFDPFWKLFYLEIFWIFKTVNYVALFINVKYVGINGFYKLPLKLETLQQLLKGILRKENFNYSWKPLNSGEHFNY